MIVNCTTSSTSARAMLLSLLSCSVRCHHSPMCRSSTLIIPMYICCILIFSSLVMIHAGLCHTRHTRHASVTHFRPISGNIVEVTLVTPPKHVYNSHTKETYFP